VQSQPVRIGTRGSPLALRQAHEVRDRLIAAHGWDDQAIAIEVIKTSGDAITHKPLREFGGKGLFTKEIEEALLSGAIDLAVHSMKDLETALPEGLVLGALLEREDVRDAFLSPRAASLMDLPEGARLGTASLRRQAQVKRARPDLDVVPFRGNVQTRMRKLEEGEADATLLAIAGLRRLGLADRATSLLDPMEMLPAVGQGAIGVEMREDDTAIGELLAPIHDQETATCIATERAFLAALDGSCHTPIAGLARLDGERLIFRGEILTPDGRDCHETAREGPPSEAVAMGADAGAELRARAGSGFFED
jgi:hydroxymethylbilane synthase